MISPGRPHPPPGTALTHGSGHRGRRPVPTLPGVVPCLSLRSPAPGIWIRVLADEACLEAARLAEKGLMRSVTGAA